MPRRMSVVVSMTTSLRWPQGTPLTVPAVRTTVGLTCQRRDSRTGRTAAHPADPGQTISAARSEYAATDGQAPHATAGMAIGTWPRFGRDVPGVAWRPSPALAAESH